MLHKQSDNIGMTMLSSVVQVLLGILGGGLPPGSSNPDPISYQKKVIFHTRFQTWPLGIIYVIIIRLESKLKSYLNHSFWISIFLFLSYSFGIETINTFKHSVVRSKTIPDSRPNGQSVYPCSDQNGAKTIPDGAAHLYGLYKGVDPPPHKKWRFTFSILFLENSFHFKKRFYQFCKRRLRLVQVSSSRNDSSLCDD